MPYALAMLRRDSGNRLPDLEDLPRSADEWDDLTLKVASHEFDIEAVLLAHGDPELFANRAELDDLIDLARRHLFGAAIGLALLTDEASSKRLFEQAASVRQWVDTAIKGGVLDFFELPEEEWTGDVGDVPGTLLRSNLDRCRENRQQLLEAAKGAVRATSWKIRPRSRRLNRLFMREPTLADSISVIVVDVPMGRAQLQLVSETDDQIDLIALLRCSEMPQLKEYRSQYHIGSTLSFSTELEAFYIARVAVALEHAPRAATHVLLITHAFDAAEDPQLAVAGSRDIGAVLRALGPNAAHRIVRRASAARTADSMREHLPKGSHLVWMHVGHGRFSAFQDTDGTEVAVDTWAKIFRGSDHQLVAAVLLACDSHGMATTLRQQLSSVRCCFGFRGKLGPDDGRTLAAALVPPLLSEAPNSELNQAYARAVDSVRIAGSAAKPFVVPESLV